MADAQVQRQRRRVRWTGGTLALRNVRVVSGRFRIAVENVQPFVGHVIRHDLPKQCVHAAGGWRRRHGGRWLRMKESDRARLHGAASVLRDRVGAQHSLDARSCHRERGEFRGRGAVECTQEGLLPTFGCASRHLDASATCDGRTGHVDRRDNGILLRRGARGGGLELQQETSGFPCSRGRPRRGVPRHFDRVADEAVHRRRYFHRRLKSRFSHSRVAMQESGLSHQ
mmetsp:Transcript_26954/g.83441  ORF Transcript_26954/g.83441 Transcript_26954/m.83441 type:complete len:227 (-) Transcript_26954:16-696(-)